MRARRTPQRSFVDVGYPNHEMGRALERISTLLDAHPEFPDWIAADVGRGRRSRRGRPGFRCEVILRCGILKQLWQLPRPGVRAPRRRVGEAFCPGKP